MRTLFYTIALILLLGFSYLLAEFGTTQPCPAAAEVLREEMQASLQRQTEGTGEGALLRLLGPALQPLVDGFLARELDRKPLHECVAALVWWQTPWGREDIDAQAAQLLAQLRTRPSG
jgi:hypothetical protein